MTEKHNILSAHQMSMYQNQFTKMILNLLINQIYKICVMNMMSLQHLVSLNYSSCADQIYISVCSFIALRKSFILLLLYCVYSLLQSFIVFLYLSIYWEINRSFS